MSDCEYKEHKANLSPFAMGNQALPGVLMGTKKFEMIHIVYTEKHQNILKHPCGFKFFLAYIDKLYDILYNKQMSV